MSDTLKENICAALATWIRQRPGLEFGNYGNVTAYRQELAGISRDKRHAETLLAAVRWRTSLTGEMLLASFRDAFSGRLKCQRGVRKGKLFIPDTGGTASGTDVDLEYYTGQYWPTEYRKAAAAVLANALWTYTREFAMPAPEGIERMYVMNSKWLTAGDWLRRHFRQEFGSAIQRRWFN